MTFGESVKRLFELLASAPSWTVLLGLGVAAAVVAVDYSRVWRFRFKFSRLQTRLDRDPFMLREEAREWNLMIGDAPDEVELPKTLVNAIQLGLVAWLGSAMFALDIDWLWDAGSMAIGLALLLYAAWRRLNDPPELRDPETTDIAIPQEAWLGLLGGVGMTAAVVGLVALL